LWIKRTLACYYGKEFPMLKRGELQERCIQEAFAFLEDHDPRELSLREIARRIGVSHQAPYKHFPTQQHLLAAVVERAFAKFADALEAVQLTDSPQADLKELGVAYITFARTHALHYRFMFGTPLDKVALSADVHVQANRAFQTLLNAVNRLDPTREHQEVLKDAVAIWAWVHGLSGIQNMGVLQKIPEFSPLEHMPIESVLDRMHVG
jgi:AcrR family transcriptional regulator